MPPKAHQVTLCSRGKHTWHRSLYSNASGAQRPLETFKKQSYNTKMNTNAEAGQAAVSSSVAQNCQGTPQLSEAAKSESNSSTFTFDNTLVWQTWYDTGVFSVGHFFLHLTGD